MSGHRQRVAVVTGASAGVGKEAARVFASWGWRVIGTGRDPGRLAAAEAEIRASAAPGAEVTMIRTDLSLMAETERLAQQIATLTNRIDVLANNAGGMPARKEMTAEGLEASFAGNYLSQFLLTERLLPLLRAAAKEAPKGTVRIINTSSDGSEYVPTLNLDDLATFETYANGLAYCSAKLAQVLHARGLAERLAADGIVAHSFHPGTADSNFFDDIDELTRAHTATLTKISLAESADTLLWLATSEEGGQSSGGYWYQRQPRAPHPLIDDAAFIARLWEVSERLVAMALS